MALSRTVKVCNMNTKPKTDLKTSDFLPPNTAANHDLIDKLEKACYTNEECLVQVKELLFRRSSCALLVKNTTDESERTGWTNQVMYINDMIKNILAL